MQNKIAKKIVTAEIINFRMHKHVILNFTDVNIFSGATETGKSTAMKAIDWCLTNQPSGTKFIRHNCNFSEVTITFDDGSIIKRRKGDKDFYELTYPNGEMIHLEGFGVGMVPEVEDLHGMHELKFLGQYKNINFSKQMQMPFFLSQTPTERAALIGKIANLEVIDLASSDLSLRLSRAKTIYKTLETRINSLEEDLKQYEDLASLKEKLKEVSKMYDNFSAKIDLIDDIRSEIKTLRNTVSKKLEVDEVINKEKDIVECLLKIEEIQEKIKQFKAISSETSSIKKNSNVLNSLYDKIKKYKIEDLEEMISSLDSSQEKMKRRQTIKNFSLQTRKDIDKLLSLNSKVEKELIVDEALKNMSSIEKLAEKIKRSKAECAEIKKHVSRKRQEEKLLSELSQEYAKALGNYENKLKEFPICPICSSKMDVEKIKSAVESL